MKETAQGFVAMIDGYNRAVSDFNDAAALVADREEELMRLEFESA